MRFRNIEVETSFDAMEQFLKFQTLFIIDYIMLCRVMNREILKIMIYRCH